MTLRIIPALHRAVHRIAVLVEQWEDLGFTQAEAHILAHLAVEGDSTIGAIHRAFGHRRSTLTSILDRLATRGLITRDVDEGDRRSFIVRLTRPGKTLAAKVLSRLEGLEALVLRGTSKAERDGFERIVQALGDAQPDIG
jgi:DNA-binding MarR family transcriptional regulator